MEENTLRKYFQDLVSVNELRKDLVDIVELKRDVSYVYIQPIREEGEFNIERKHLIKLCKACLENQLSVNDLSNIAFALLASEYFVWDITCTEGELIDQLITDWDNPDLNGELTMDYLQNCLSRLNTVTKK